MPYMQLELLKLPLLNLTYNNKKNSVEKTTKINK